MLNHTVLADRGLIGAIMCHLGVAAEPVGDLNTAERRLLEDLAILHTTSLTALKAVMAEQEKSQTNNTSS